jgi:hypothetical protein
MPPGGPKLSAANLALLKAWIDAAESVNAFETARMRNL